MGDLGERRGVVLDRHPLWLEALECLLSRIDLTVVASATTAARALEFVDERRPDFLIVGLDPENADADLETIRRARTLSSTLRIIALAAENDPARVEAAFAAGATAYILNTVEPSDLVAAVRHSFGRSIYFAESQLPRPSLVRSTRNVDLTRREKEILRLVAEGYTNGEVARMLWVTEKTVKFHLSNVYRKLNVSNRTQATFWAARTGLVPTEVFRRTSARGDSSRDRSRVASAG